MKKITSKLFTIYLNICLVCSIVLLTNCLNPNGENNGSEITQNENTNPIKQNIICAGKQCKGNCNQPKNGCPKKNNKIKCIGKNCLGNCIKPANNCGDQNLVCQYCNINTYKRRNFKINCENSCDGCESKVKGECKGCKKKNILLKTKKEGGINAYCSACNNKLYECTICNEKKIPLKNKISDNPESKKCQNCLNAVLSEEDFNALDTGNVKQIFSNILKTGLFGTDDYDEMDAFGLYDRVYIKNYIEKLIKYKIVKIKKYDYSVQPSLENNDIIKSLPKLKAAIVNKFNKSDDYKKPEKCCIANIVGRKFSFYENGTQKTVTMNLNAENKNDRLEIDKNSLRSTDDGNYIYFYLYSNDGYRVIVSTENLEKNT